MSDDTVRAGVAMLKKHFLAWKDPPVELPAEHVIERVVRSLLYHANVEAESRGMERAAKIADAMGFKAGNEGDSVANTCATVADAIRADDKKWFGIIFGKSVV